MPCLADLGRVHGFTFGDSLDDCKRNKWQDFKSRLLKVLNIFFIFLSLVSMFHFSIFLTKWGIWPDIGNLKSFTVQKYDNSSIWIYYDNSSIWIVLQKKFFHLNNNKEKFCYVRMCEGENSSKNQSLKGWFDPCCGDHLGACILQG